MNAGDKFLVTAMVIFCVLVVHRVTPLGAFLMIVVLFALAYHMCRKRYRR